MPDFLRLLPKPGRVGTLLSASIAAALVAMWLIFAGIAYETYRDEWEKSAIFCADVATLLEQDIARNIELYDLSIRAAARDFDDANVRALPMDLQRKVLFDQSANASGLGSILILDRKGDVVMDSRARATMGLNLADRDYFIAQRDGTDQFNPFISHPFKSRITNATAIGFSRRRAAADGSFKGIVVGTMTLGYLTHLFEGVHLPPGSTITLVHQDGTVLLRQPEMPGAVGASIAPSELSKRVLRGSSGLFVKHSVFDNTQRLFAYRRIGDLPVFMTVGLSTRELLRRWRWRVGSIGLGFVLLTAIILFLGYTLARELDRRRDAERILSDLAATDGLTLLANRRRFDEMLEIEWRRAVRETTTLSLLMIDGDFFKAFNDSYGHLEGDEALRNLAGALRTCVARPGDLIARFGGEEFVALLPRTDTDGAELIANSIRQAVGDLGKTHRGSPMGILTVSIGVASRQPTTSTAASDLVEAADAALYAAKAAGRDRIVVAGTNDNSFFTTPAPKVA